ncbi:MAG: ATP-dependent helicase [Anaerolineae bacterium]|nr:ATP-dependent helicase [Anaerolineae bacterium]
MNDVRFRFEQEVVLRYSGGKMGISAVPGSGKTFTLAHLAARLTLRLLREGRPNDNREVLVVTFANAAANSIRRKIEDQLKGAGIALGTFGYRVRTLHGLAHDIVRERPSLAGLAQDFKIVDERAAQNIREEVVSAWLKANGISLFLSYLEPEWRDKPNKLAYLSREELPKLAQSLAEQFIRQAKDQRLTPQAIRAKLDKLPESALPLVRFGCEVYENYQRALSYRGVVDFDDLVMLALWTLEQDAAFLERQQARYIYILEDEAQDSSRLQQDLLSLLSAHGNWVRVGDPNQAINTTFTTADPKYLRAFLQEAGVERRTLSVSGRSAPPIVELANYLVKWTRTQHPTPALRDTFLDSSIKLTTPDDAQPNPPAEEARLHIAEVSRSYSPDDEINIVADSLVRWLQGNKERTVAALVPDNNHGFKLAERLRALGVPHEELLRSTSSTRETAKRLETVIRYLAKPIAPQSAALLADLYRDVWWQWHLGARLGAEAETWLTETHKRLAALKRIELFLFPETGVLLTEALSLPELAELEPLYLDLEAFRETVQRWLHAAHLPIDQLVLTIGQDIFKTPPEIALGYKLAQLLRSYADDVPAARLSEFAAELRRISANERRFIGFDQEEVGYEPKKGVVTVATMHAAKGLEWDRVYLLSVNNYSFPSALPEDRYLDEKYYLRDSLNLSAEVRAQLDSLITGSDYVEGNASAQARLDYAAERLRLLYVGITRAKRELIISWNNGRFGYNPEQQQQPALPFLALRDFWQRQVTASTEA